MQPKWRLDPAHDDAATLNDTLSKAEKHLQLVGENASARRLMKLRLALDHPHLRLVVFGEFNRGKSTLINALLGRLVLPAKLIPTTGHVTQVVFSQKEEIHIEFTDRRKESHSLDRLGDFSTLDINGVARDDVESVVVKVRCSLLQGVILIDTPGINDRGAQTRRAQTAIALADVVLLMLDARQLLSAGERELAVDWLGKSLNKPVIPVVNFMNFLEEADQRDVRLRLDRWSQGEPFPGLGRSWFEVSALGALKHALGGSPPPADHFQALRSAVAHCSGPIRHQLQRRSRRSQLLAEVRQAQHENLALMRRIREDAAKVERERTTQLQELQELRRRFDANARLQRERLCAFAEQTLASKLDLLLGVWFKGETKARLEAKASGWYEAKLTEAMGEIEKEADGALLALTGDNLRRPESLTLRERMILNVRLAVGEVAWMNARAVKIGVGAGLGAVLGTMLIPIPVVGTLLGAGAGGLISRFFGAAAPDPVTAYSASATTKWTSDAREIVNILQGQYDVRIADLKSQLDERLESISAQPLSLELHQRESLEAALSACERALER